jgi:lysophospholipid acyltransferase (LPLAT)-like uncharacterized protein
LVLPRPYTSITFVVGAPVSVTADADEAALESARSALEQSLEAARLDAERWAADSPRARA